MPGPTNQAQFPEGTGVPTQLEVSLEDGDVSRGLRHSGGSNVLLTLGAGDEVDFSAVSLLAGAGPASSGGTLEISGPGSLDAGIITIGSNSSSADDNHLIFSNGVEVSDTAGTWTGIGRFRKNNSMRVESGADVTRYSIWLGHGDGDTSPDATRGNSGNHIVVTGAGSILRHNRFEGGTSNVHFRVGTIGYVGDSYETALHNNYVLVQDGGTVEVTAETGSSNLWVGNAALSRSNYVLVEGTNSRLRVLDGNTTLIGNAAGTNLGGNYIEVRDGGEFEATGTVWLRDHDSSGQNDGDNLLVIGPGGTFTSSGNIISTGGNLRLHETGNLTANLIEMRSGRFEAGGGTLVANSRLEIQDGATFAIGITGDSSASSFTLASSADLLNGSTFATSIFGSGANDIGQLNLAIGADMDLSSDVVFQLSLVNYNPALGDEWTVFTGLTNLIDGDFKPALADLPSLSGGLEWDLTGFNEEGGWVVAVIPEPGMLALLSLASGFLLLRRRNVNLAV